MCDNDEMARLRAELGRLRNAAATLATAQRIAHFGTWEWDVRTGEVTWSDEVYRIFGLDPETFQPQIDSILALSPLEEQGRGKELVERSIASRLGGSYEQTFYRPDGTKGTYLSTFEPVFDEHGELVRMVGVAHDISERKRAEAERNELADKYQQALRMESLGRLAGGIAHDLNNLLTPILGYADLLQARLASQPDVLAQVAPITQAAEQARDLVSRLLAFGRKQILMARPHDVNRVITEFESLLRRTIREDIEFRLDLAAGLPTVFIDRSQLEQVLMNLAVNSMDAMPDGGVFAISTRLTPSDKCQTDDGARERFVTITVSDTGVGMDQGTRAQVFDPFFTTKVKNKGTGLGLATVYGIVHQHGGDIRLESEPGEGAVFHIAFPACDQPPTVRRTEGQGRERSPENSETILVAEDSQEVRFFVNEALDRQGFKVVTASSGQACLKLISRYTEPIDLLVTDVVMPDINGRQLAAEAIKLRPQLRVLFMSGYDDDVIATHGVLDESIPFIQKPFTGQDLTSKVRWALRQPPLILPE